MEKYQEQIIRHFISIVSRNFSFKKVRSFIEVSESGYGAILYTYAVLRMLKDNKDPKFIRFNRRFIKEYGRSVVIMAQELERQMGEATPK